MYRSRLGTDLSDITLDYVSSINDDSEIALYDILGSQAHALMLFQKNCRVDGNIPNKFPWFMTLPKSSCLLSTIIYFA